MRYAMIVVAMLGMVAGIANSAPRSEAEVTHSEAAAAMEDTGPAEAMGVELCAGSPEEALACSDLQCTQVCLRRGFCDGFCNSFGSCRCVDPSC